MKLRFEKRRGSILTMILVSILLMGITLGSYLTLVSSQSRAVTHSQQWNAAIPIAEAGIEEAMAHLNKNLSDRTADGWTDVGTNVVRERTLGQDKFIVRISKDVEPPFILSEGYVLDPSTKEFLEPRKVRVQTVSDGLFAKVMVGKSEIELSGKSLETDSYDSSDPKYSNADGTYNPDKIKDNGDIATNSKDAGALDLRNAKIRGHVAVGPGATVLTNSATKIGDKAWHAATNKFGIKSGWSSDDMNVQFPDVKKPAPGLAVTYDGTNYHANHGTFEMDSLTLNEEKKLHIKGNVTLLVKGDVKIVEKGAIVLDSDASLQLYVEGENTTIGGGGIVNPSGLPSHLGIWGLPSNESVSVRVRDNFYGTIYAPQASLTLSRSKVSDDDDSDDSDDDDKTPHFFGSAVADSVKIKGRFAFHYDEAMAKTGPRRGYTIVSWSESDWEKK